MATYDPMTGNTRAGADRPTGVPDRVRRYALGALLCALALIAGCASVPRHPPRIDVTEVRIDRIAGPDAYFTVAISLANPDGDDVVINALEGSLAIEGERVAEATLNSPVHVPAGGRAQAELSTHAGMDAVLRAVAAAMRRGASSATPGARPTLHYAIAGRATLANGAQLPFGRTGDIGE